MEKYKKNVIRISFFVRRNTRKIKLTNDASRVERFIQEKIIK